MLEDDETAFGWYKLAGASRRTRRVQLASMYDHGEGGANYGRQLAGTRAAEKGLASAQFNLLNMILGAHAAR